MYQPVDNPDYVNVICEFATDEAARAFAASEKLKAAIEGPSVFGAPTMWVAKRV